MTSDIDTPWNPRYTYRLAANGSLVRLLFEGTSRARWAALGEEHRRGIGRFWRQLEAFAGSGLLSRDQAEIIGEYGLRLGERKRNPANTGNIEDLFSYTLRDTKDPVRAFAQAMADTIKVVPMDPDARLRPTMRQLGGTAVYTHVRDFTHLSEGDRMLVTHTMVACGDTEMLDTARALVLASGVNEATVEREVARMCVQSQHHPSSTFVLARAHGLTLECGDLYRAAGYGDQEIRDAQCFYDVCAEFNPTWAQQFVHGEIPANAGWLEWRARYLDARTRLPPELIYQLSSDTLTNFLEGTLESGKWTDASVQFGGVTSAGEVPQALRRIVNQYLAEHVALHDRPARELTYALTTTLRPWGIGFEDDRAIVLNGGPEKADALEAQFDAAWARKNGH